MAWHYGTRREISMSGVGWTGSRLTPITANAVEQTLQRQASRDLLGVSTPRHPLGSLSPRVGVAYPLGMGSVTERGTSSTRQPMTPSASVRREQLSTPHEKPLPLSIEPWLGRLDCRRSAFSPRPTTQGGPGPLPRPFAKFRPLDPINLNQRRAIDRAGMDQLVLRRVAPEPVMVFSKLADACTACDRKPAMPVVAWNPTTF
mmetsp:Transcript_48774/g.144124  ORF Transcript_48774/g.144124 Transcript_48774/m.144124 type:complete len:202 (-) Transcript_48774:356-961(-)